MPLNVQPLSPARRMLLVAVLVVFLGISLGFAQYLVTRRQQRAFVADNFAAFGFAAPAPLAYPEEIEARTAVLHRLPRRLDLFGWEVDSALTPEEQTDAVGNLFIEIMNVVPQMTGPARLAGYDAVQAAGVSPNGRFAFVRLAQVQDHLVAICYSGPAPYTDADKAAFAAICTGGLRFTK